MPGNPDIISQRFGQLVALKFAGRNYHKQPRWLCQCDCGAQVVVYLHALRGGTQLSCGYLPAHPEERPGLTLPPPPTEEEVWRVKVREIERSVEKQQVLEATRAAVRNREPLPVPQVRVRVPR